MAEKLVHYTCEICGESLELSLDKLSAKCKFCGTEYYFKEDNSEALILALNRANLDRLRCDFADAIKGYKVILNEYPDNAEAHWGLVLSTYGIEYVKDTRTQKYIPTCHRAVEESVLKHPNYLQALKNGATEQKAIFENKAKEIDLLQKRIKAKMQDEEEFEVFISFKSTDANGNPTKDRTIARRIRDELEKRGIKTFFSDVTLKGRLGDEYEPIIYKALNTCKAFILVGTSKENINAVWVKNEWSRFEERIEKEHLQGTWFAVFENINANDLPNFLHTQGIDLAKYPAGGYEIEIADSLELKLGKRESETEQLKKQLEEQNKAREQEQKQREEQFLAQQKQIEELQAQQKAREEEQRKKEQEASKPKKKKGLLVIALVLALVVAITSAIVIVSNNKGKGGTLPSLSTSQSSSMTSSTMSPSTNTSQSDSYLNSGNTASQSTSSNNTSVNGGTGLLEDDLDLLTDGNEYFITGVKNTNLTQIVIPATYNNLPITTINANAFKNCINLQSITLGEKLTSIGNFAFYGCINLTKINYNATELTDLQVDNFVFDSAGKNASGITLTIGANVKKIPAYLFAPSGFGANPNIKEVEFYANSVCASIGECAFIGCQQLNKFIMPNSIKTIGDGVFSGCTNLQSITLGGNLNSIGNFTFSSCTSLTSVVIGEKVTSIGEGAFEDCTSLTSVNYTGTIDQWMHIEFGNEYANPLYYAKKLYINGELVTSANITTATKINDYAFLGCDDLTNITIPNSVTSIGRFAFAKCINLTNITLPNYLTNIGSAAFFGCINLTNITIPNNVINIGEYAFTECSNLSSVTFIEPSGWDASGTSLTSTDLAITSTAAAYLRDTYDNYFWKRNV